MTRCDICGHDNPPGTLNCDGCGAALSAGSAARAPAIAPAEVGALRSLVEQGRKIEAVKRYRELTSAGLKEALDAVEAIARGEAPPAAPSHERDDPGLDRELTELLRGGRKIEAIKRYREATGAGLKDAKDAVERLAARQGIEARRGSGCLGVLAFATLTGAAVGWRVGVWAGWL